MAVRRSSPARPSDDVATFAVRLVHGRPGADRVAGAPFGAPSCFAAVRVHFDEVERTVARYLGLEVSRIRELVAAGATLADVATARGRSVDELEHVVLDALHAIEADPQHLLADVVEELVWVEGQPGERTRDPAAA